MFRAAMRPALPLSLLAVSGFVTAFVAGRLSVSERAEASGGAASRSTSPSSGLVAAESQSDRVPSKSRLSAGDALDPATTIANVIAIVANEPPGLAGRTHYAVAVMAFLNAQCGRLDKETARGWARSIRDEKLRSVYLE